MEERNKLNSNDLLTHEIPESNSLGLAGMVISILGCMLGWIPVFGWIVWVLGLVFSSIGMNRKPKLFARIGLIISLLSLLIIIDIYITAKDFYDIISDDSSLEVLLEDMESNRQ
jgi:hypothetical protein